MDTLGRYQANQSHPASISADAGMPAMYKAFAVMGLLAFLLAAAALVIAIIGVNSGDTDTTNNAGQFGQVKAASTAELPSRAPPSDTNRFILNVGGTFTMDGVTIEEGDRVLLKDQTNEQENRIYVKTGSFLQPAVQLTTDSQIVQGDSVVVEQGTVNRGSRWAVYKVDTADTDAFEQSGLVWTNFTKQDLGASTRNVASGIPDPAAGAVLSYNGQGASGTRWRTIVAQDAAHVPSTQYPTVNTALNAGQTNILVVSDVTGGETVTLAPPLAESVVITIAKGVTYDWNDELLTADPGVNIWFNGFGHAVRNTVPTTAQRSDESMITYNSATDSLVAATSGSVNVFCKNIVLDNTTGATTPFFDTSVDAQLVNCSVYIADVADNFVLGSTTGARSSVDETVFYSTDPAGTTASMTTVNANLDNCTFVSETGSTQTTAFTSTTASNLTLINSLINLDDGSSLENTNVATFPTTPSTVAVIGDNARVSGCAFTNSNLFTLGTVAVTGTIVTGCTFDTLTIGTGAAITFTSLSFTSNVIVGAWTFGADTFDTCSFNDNTAASLALDAANTFTNSNINDNNILGTSLFTGTLTEFSAVGNSLEGLCTVNGTLDTVQVRSNNCGNRLDVNVASADRSSIDGNTISNLLDIDGPFAPRCSISNNIVSGLLRFGQNVATSLDTCAINGNVMNGFIMSIVGSGLTLNDCTFNNNVSNANFIITGTLTRCTISGNAIGSLNFGVSGDLAVFSEVIVSNNMVTNSATHGTDTTSSDITFANNTMNSLICIIAAGGSIADWTIKDNRFSAAVTLDARVVAMSGLIFSGNNCATTVNFDGTFSTMISNGNTFRGVVTWDTASNAVGWVLNGNLFVAPPVFLGAVNTLFQFSFTGNVFQGGAVDFGNGGVDPFCTAAATGGTSVVSGNTFDIAHLPMLGTNFDLAGAVGPAATIPNFN